MIKTLQIGTWTLLAILFLEGCGTVTPNPIEDNMPTYDSSTPRQYDQLNSGLLFYTTNDRGETDGAIITKNARDRYNNLISSYALQIYDEEKVTLLKDAGIWYYQDKYGNELYKIENQYLAFFMKMNRWKKQGRSDDTAWAKLKNKVGL
jgi:hypothetical protein